MTSVRAHRRSRRKRPSVAPSIAPPDFFSPPESGEELFNQLAGPLGGKPFANSPPTANNVPKYPEDDLQRILKAVLEAWAPIPASAPAPAPAPVLAPAPIVAKAYRKKLKGHSQDLYRGKSHIDYYNFCQ